MAVAPAALRRQFRLKAFLPLRSAFSTSSRCLAAPPQKAQKAPKAPKPYRFIPDPCRIFFRPNGTLSTDQDGLDFLTQYDIEHDSGMAIDMTLSPKIRSMVKDEYGISPKFCPRHMISPHEVAYFDPRGHPMASAMKKKWARMSKKEPFWLVVTCASSSVPNIVRGRSIARYRSAIYKALEEKGYDKFGHGKNGNIKGTLYLVIYEPMKAIHADSNRIGTAIVDSLEDMAKFNQNVRTFRPGP